MFTYLIIGCGRLPEDFGLGFGNICYSIVYVIVLFVFRVRFWTLNSNFFTYMCLVLCILNTLYKMILSLMNCALLFI